jgi:tripartite ATP-independent transporter DctM subunit
VTLIVYGIATETSIGRLFMAGVIPGIMLTLMFMTWAIIDCRRKGYEFAARSVRYSLKERLSAMPRILPFLLIIAGTLYVLYGGIATPSEAAGAGALLTLIVVIVAYRLFRFSAVSGIFASAMRESVMIMMIMAAAELFAFALSSLFITQTIATFIADMDVNRWVLMGIINVFLLVCGMFLPPVAVIVMTAPMLFPIVTQAGFDPYWFAIVLTINMEVGLITPPIGLNLFVINAIAPTVPTKDILWGALPYVLVMFLAIFILCLFPEIATWLPNQMLGVVE